MASPTQSQQATQVREWFESQLVELVMRKTGLTDEPEESSSPDSSAYLCIEDILQKVPDSVYRFRPDDLDDHAAGRQSFNDLLYDWQCASKDRKRDGGSFPEVRKKKSQNSIPFIKCILRCTCERCRNGLARDLTCKPFDFGDGNEQIFIHQFKHSGKTWAIILGDSGEDCWPPKYWVWGVYKDDEMVTAYNMFIHLQEPDKAAVPAASRKSFGRPSMQSNMILPGGEREETSEERSDTDQRYSERKRGKRPTNITADRSTSKKSRSLASLFSDDESDSAPNHDHSNRSYPPFLPQSQTPLNHIKEPASKRNVGDDDDDAGNDEDEEDSDIPLKSSRALRRHAKPSATNPNIAPIQEQNTPTRKPPIPQQPQLKRTPPTHASFDISTKLSTAYSTARTHILAQKQAGTSRSILFTNPALQELMQELDTAAKTTNEWVFGQMWEVIDDILIGDGLEKLPGR
ncbi:hypothetical protein Q7P37_002217 [Cladosporium fusiforme]